MLYNLQSNLSRRPGGLFEAGVNVLVDVNNVNINGGQAAPALAAQQFRVDV